MKLPGIVVKLYNRPQVALHSLCCSRILLRVRRKHCDQTATHSIGTIQFAHVRRSYRIVLYMTIRANSKQEMSTGTVQSESYSL